MQSDDTANPACSAVLEGEALWNRKAGAAALLRRLPRDAAESMRGVAARYPAFDAGTGGPIDLEGRINLAARSTRGRRLSPVRARKSWLVGLCRPPVARHADRPGGLPAGAFLERGRGAYQQRQGQLNFSCADCHDDNWGKQLGGSVIPQGHPTGYPLYRLEWQAMGSLQRRLRNCMAGVRAEPYSYGSP